MATLTTTIKEDISLHGNKYGGIKTLSFTGINEIFSRVVTVTATETALIGFGANWGSGTISRTSVRYLRITNLDGDQAVMLNVEGDNATDFTVRVDPGASYIIAATAATGVDDYADISGQTLEGLSGIKADSVSGSIDLELFVASI